MYISRASARDGIRSRRCNAEVGSKQHVHASAFHLREFTGDDGRVARVTKGGRISHHHPKAVCFVTDALTDPDVPENQRFWLEDELRDYETQIAPVVKRTLDAVRAGAQPSDTDEAFTMYLTLQFGRSMHQGDWIQNIDATASVARARSDLMPHQYAALMREFPVPRALHDRVRSRSP